MKSIYGVKLKKKEQTFRTEKLIVFFIIMYLDPDCRGLYSICKGL